MHAIQLRAYRDLYLAQKWERGEQEREHQVVLFLAAELLAVWIGR